jgi:hypothetical protein
MGMFLALIAVAVAISGTLAFSLFWAMTLVHLRDRHFTVLQGLGTVPFIAFGALAWLLMGRYRALEDRSLNGLATPARLALWCTLGALAMAGLLWLIYR